MPNDSLTTKSDPQAPIYALTEPRTSMRLSHINILIIDPDKRVADLLRKVLISLGFGAIYLARDGTEGLRLLHQKPIDLVITDWEMEPMDGLAFMRYIRTSEQSPNRQMPIIMLTGKAQRKHVETARDVGMTEFVVKPFSVRTLCDRIILVIEHPRSFILSKNYVGPDRRRRQGKPSSGLERRTNPEDRKNLVSVDKDSKVIRAGDEDVTIMKAASKMKEKIGPDVSMQDVFNPENVRTAQEILINSQGDFLQWIVEDTRAMEHAFRKIESVNAHTSDDARALYRTALTIKSQAGTFGFDLASSVAESLMVVLEGCKHIDEARRLVIRKHMDALYVIFQRNIQGMGGNIGKELLESLHELSKKYR